MSSNFFNNYDTKLIDKFKGISENMTNFYSFLAVVGYFRSSGYFKLRKHLDDVKEIKILVGINIDNIFRKHDKSLLMLEGEDEAREQFTDDFINDVINAKYDPEVEEGILQLCKDLVSGKVQMRIDKSKNLHAKFYLCLPQNHNENSDGWVIMGSSNISDAGLGISQPPRYELNVALKDYDDVHYCHEEFNQLWEESIPLTPEDICRIKPRTHLDKMPTPYELYIKVLIDAFKGQVEDKFTMTLPDGYMDLRYQRDAVIQGYQMLKDYNGFFLADVVGTGKTIVGTMIAKRFIEENGKNTKVLVIYPPAVEKNWKDTFKDFGIGEGKPYAQFITNGSLSKVLDSTDNYLAPEEFDLILVDEAHNFRSDATLKYDELQRICKSPRFNEGMIEGIQKKVVLLSATPLNNKPEDFLNLILLFQDARFSNIEGVGNLNFKFQPWIKRYKEIMKERYQTNNNSELAKLTEEVDTIYEQMRTEVLNKILVRRTRKNLINNPDYKEDLDLQGVKFPHINQPNECLYKLNDSLSTLFGETMTLLSDTYDAELNPKGTGLDYARYRAIEFLTGEAKKKYKQAKHITGLLSEIYRVHMVKRLESSFFAFKKSLNTFIKITEDMIKMFDEDKILIAPDFDVKGMLAKDMELDEIIEKIAEKGMDKSDFVFKTSDFDSKFLDMLKNDLQKAKTFCARWDKVNEDPKLDEFINLLKGELFDKKRNKTGKLVVFSESVDTLNYLNEQLNKSFSSKGILLVYAGNRTKSRTTIDQNFDANYKGEKLNKFNIILTSDVLAEGVNLHRSNIIVNYDSPWNATRLMQRIGRVNRIGSVSDNIYNYLFYPSAQGDEEIKLYQNALIKLQGFHAALGEDAQIYSRQEVLHTFKLFDENVRDRIDKQLELLREIRELYATDPKLYKKIKSLPPKSRTVRKPENCSQSVISKTSIVYITKGDTSQFYKIVGDEKPQKIEFVDAAEILKAKAEESAGNFSVVKDIHYEQVNKAFECYLQELEEAKKAPTLKNKKNDNGTKALSLIRQLKRAFRNHPIYKKLLELEIYVKEGTYNNLTKGLNQLNIKIGRMTKNGSHISQHTEEIIPTIESFYNKYHISKERIQKEENTDDPIIVTSETFE